jgi:choline dehydrogenase-like flavoprotein
MPTVTLLTRAEVVRLETDPAGRTVTGVVVDRGGDGKEEVYHGDIVVLAAGAANTAKILLRSASEACDTSFFPSIGAVNPALTAIANAIRVGERIADRLGASVSASAQSWAPAPRQAPAGAAEAPSAAERN